MSGWSTGGYGDGTAWGRERASGRQTGVHWGGGANGGNNGSSGKASVSILKIGEFHTTKWGTVVINAEGLATMNGIIMTAENSSFVENGPNEFTRVLNSLIRDTPPKRGDNVNKDNVGGVFYGLPGHINVADTGRFLGEHGDKPEYYVRSESNIYSVTVLNEKQDLHPTLAYGKHSPNMSARRYTENRAEDLLRAYLNEINDAVKFTADFFKETTAKYGENSAAIARELADSAKGKKLRNATEAMQAYNKYGPAIMKKFSVADREAIARALESVNRDLVAKNLAKFSKAFGAVGYTIDAVALAKELAKGIRTGDFTSFYVKVETLSAGLVASSLVAFTFAVLTTTPFGILAYGLLLALTGALIDEKLIQKINSAIFN